MHYSMELLWLLTHVSGAILLLKEAYPYLSGKELKLALYHSARDLGVPGEDNKFGMGIINVYDAYLYLLAKVTSQFLV